MMGQEPQSGGVVWRARLCLTLLRDQMERIKDVEDIAAAQVVESVIDRSQSMLEELQTASSAIPVSEKGLYDELVETFMALAAPRDPLVVDAEERAGRLLTVEELLGLLRRQ